VLFSNPIALLLTIVILGHALGRLEVRSFSLDSSGIIFAGLVFGYAGYTLPADLQTLGLVLFIYSIGLQAGPGFLSAIKSNGLRLSAGAACVVATGFVTALTCSLVFGFGGDISAGLFAGALTSTPGLAVAVEMVDHGSPAAAYGVTYLFGVVGVILFIKLLPRIMGIDVAREEARLEAALRRSQPRVGFAHLEISNPNLIGKKIRDIFLAQISGVTVTRLLRKGAAEPELVSGDTVLENGDHIRVVGLQKDIEKAELYLGRTIEAEIAFNASLVNRKIVVSKDEIIGRTLHSLNFTAAYNVQVSRITRNGFDIPAHANTRLNKGDILHGVGQAQSVKNLRKCVGDDMRELYSANVVSVLFGIFIGFLLGRLPLFFPGAGVFHLGTTGGVLVAGIALGHLKRTGPFTWDVPVTSNVFIRELGLMLFLAVVGTSAGATIVPTLQQFGLPLMASGILVTLVPLTAAFLVCRYVLKLPFLRILGVLTGGMTSTPGLATATALSDTQYASSAYATVYPVALIGMILFTKLIVWIL
jgi:putative transport protein